MSLNWFSNLYRLNCSSSAQLDHFTCNTYTSRHSLEPKQNATTGISKMMTIYDDIVMCIGDEVIEKIEDYICPGHVIKWGKENQTYEINRRVWQTRAAVRKLSHILRDTNILINLKRTVFNICILLVMRYGMKTIPLTIKSAKKLRTTQRTLERMILEISFKDHISNAKRVYKKSASDSTKQWNTDYKRPMFRSGPWWPVERRRRHPGKNKFKNTRAICKPFE